MHAKNGMNKARRNPGCCAVTHPEEEASNGDRSRSWKSAEFSLPTTTTTIFFALLRARVEMRRASLLFVIVFRENNRMCVADFYCKVSIGGWAWRKLGLRGNTFVVNLRSIRENSLRNIFFPLILHDSLAALSQSINLCDRAWKLNDILCEVINLIKPSSSEFKNTVLCKQRAFVNEMLSRRE